MEEKASPTLQKLLSIILPLLLAGHVMLTKELLFHTGASEYVLEVTPSDHRASNDPRNLTIFIISKLKSFFIDLFSI